MPADARCHRHLLLYPPDNIYARVELCVGHGVHINADAALVVALKADTNDMIVLIRHASAHVKTAPLVDCAVKADPVIVAERAPSLI